MTTYQVKTEIRNYDNVHDPHYFSKRVRKIWGDQTPIKAVFEWDNEQGWLEIDPVDFLLPGQEVDQMPLMPSEEEYHQRQRAAAERQEQPGPRVTAHITEIEFECLICEEPFIINGYWEAGELEAGTITCPKCGQEFSPVIK